MQLKHVTHNSWQICIVEPFKATVVYITEPDGMQLDGILSFF